MTRTRKPASPSPWGRPVPLLAALSLLGPAAGTSRGATWCNPIDIDYRYNWEQEARGISYRSGADPVIVKHGGEYQLFVTISGGWWHSKDLLHWEFVTPNTWPKEDMCAPAAASVDGTLYLFQSTFDRRPIYTTRAPSTGRLEFFNPRLPYMPGAPGPWDPALFHDDDTGRWFMYFGSSNIYPIYGIELDPRHQLDYMGTATEMVKLMPELHGWERFGQDHRSPIQPFIEGAWMTKHNGKYYLQYAGPGTEYNVYANGTYVGDSPMGPFTYAPNNPVSYKPGGFVTGAGHGNTFQDDYGNYWNTGTPWVAVNFDFERRVAMFPAGFDRDGLLYANTRFGDFPHRIPDRKWEHRDELFTGWMLLSYRKRCDASSTQSPFPPAALTDENPRTFWLAGSARPGEWASVDLGQECEVRAVQVNFSDWKSGLYHTTADVYTDFRLLHSRDGREWLPLAEPAGPRRDRANAYLELPAPVRTRHIRYEHRHIGSPNLAISDLRVFGKADGPVPSTPGGLEVRRDSDPRNAWIRWHPVPGVVGYNLLWGIAPDKLYQTYQVFADHGTELELRALSVGQSYWFAVEAFDERGVSAQGDAVRIP
jgi:hypothetical protein